MNLKPKAWYWKLTWPFAHDSYTTIGDDLFFPRGFPPNEMVVAHEEIHRQQQKEIGLVKFVLLYLFVFPFLWNPFRFKWELEAYVMGSRMSVDGATRLLRSKDYGWLKFNRRRKK